MILLGIFLLISLGCLALFIYHHKVVLTFAVYFCSAAAFVTLVSIIISPLAASVAIVHYVTGNTYFWVSDSTKLLLAFVAILYLILLSLLPVFAYYSFRRLYYISLWLWGAALLSLLTDLFLHFQQVSNTLLPSLVCMMFKSLQ